MNIRYNNNPYYDSAKGFFNELVELIKNEPRLYACICKHKHKALYNWVNTVIKPLQSSIYKFSTRCYWILSGITEFPVCPICGKSDGFVGKNVKVSIGYFKYCSTRCVNLDPVVNSKKENACLRHFGVKHPLQAKQCMDKYKTTCLTNFGTDHNFKASSCIEKRRCTWLDTYGVENPNSSDIIKAAKEATFIGRYGSSNPSLIPEFIEKRRITMLDRYGVENPMQIPGIVETIADTVFRRYGVRYISQSHEFRVRAKQKYFYDGMYFSSTPEVAFYIWHIDSGIGIEYQPKRDLWYEYDGILHRYHPDFDVDGVLYELKGDQFLNDDGTWRNPYDRSQDGVYEAKHKCCIRNGVRILYKSDYDQYIEYVERRYGRHYIMTFKMTPGVGK